MKNIFKAIISSLLLMLLVTSFLVAGNGKIAGVIKDNNGKPVPGATLMVLGTKLGGFADVDGRYFVLNIPPGKYDVSISAVGYNKKTVKLVDIKSDLTTELNAIIQESAVEVEGVTVEAEKRVVDKTLTSTRSTISSDELSNALPVSSTYEILQSTPSVYRGFVRGGTQSQTKTVVEGVDVSDSYYSVAADQTVTAFNGYNRVVRFRESQQATSVSVNQNSVSELTVNTGAVGAEYFSASAGVINYSLKEGKGDLVGKLYLRSGTKRLGIAGPAIYGDQNLYFTERNSLYAKATASDSVKARRYTWTEGAYENGQNPLEADFSISGALAENLGFFLSSNFKNNPDCRLPNQMYKEFNTQLKLTYNPSSEIKISALGVLDDKGKLFGWKNTNYQESMRFFLQGVPQNDGLDWVGSLKLTHFLSSSTFYEVQVSNKNTDHRIGFVDGNNDGQLQLNEKGDFLTWNDTASVNRYMSKNILTKAFTTEPGNDESTRTSMQGPNNSYYLLLRPGIFYEGFKNNVFTAKADFTSQLSYNHQLKVGVSYKLNELDMDRKAAYIGGDDPARPYTIEKWNVKPLEFGAYIQDRMEYAGLVINLGLRYDLWDPKAADYKTFFAPNIVSTETTSEGTFKVKRPVRGDNVDPRTFLSPRIAVSHPVSDKAAIYFSFSKMFQPPPYSMIYTDYNDFGNPSLPNILTVTREPYKTTNYEMGGQWEIFDKVGLNVNAYYRNIENYINGSFSVKTRATTYYLYYSTGYADARGIELTLEGMQTDVTDFLKVSGRVSYTYSYVKGARIVGSGVSSENPSAFTTVSDSLRLGGQIPFSDVQYYRKFETNLGGGSSSLTSGYDRAHRIAYTLFLRFPYEISVTSIGTFQSGFWYSKVYVDPRIAGRELAQSPWNSQIDLRIEKAFRLDKYRIAVFADIKNLFDKENIIAYDASTFTGTELWEKKGDPTGTKNRPVNYDGSLFYDIPREVYVGISLDF